MYVCMSEEVSNGHLAGIFVGFFVTYVRDQIKTLAARMNGIIHIYIYDSFN